MEPTRYIWQNGALVEWADAKVHVLTHSLHYGGGAFEGIRVYDTARGPAVFRLKEHIDRLFYSAGVLKMEIPYSRDDVCAAVVECLKKNGLRQGYVRPLAYYGYGVMGINPRNAPVELAVACWPWGAYLPHDAVDVKVSSYIRIHPGSTVADAKICGHYVNSMLAVLELRGTHYHEALLLDSEGKIAEGPGENFFLVRNGTLVTPPLGTILAGITRRTVCEIAAASGIPVTEAPLTVDDVYDADEAFFTGTAAEITPIRSLDDRMLRSDGVGTVSARIRGAYLDAVYGRDGRFASYLTFWDGGTEFPSGL